MRRILPILLIGLGVLAAAFTITKTTTSNDIDLSQKLPEVLTVQDENGSSIVIDSNRIPLYEAYLDSQDDRRTAMQRTQLDVLHLSDQEHFLLLKYNCGNKQCSTILVKESGAKITSLALVDGIFQDYEGSPGKNEVLLRYAYNEGGEVVRHVLIAVDLMSMKVIPYESALLAEEYMHDPVWPIVDYQWIDNDRFIIDSADISSSGFEAVKDWYDSPENKTKKVELSLIARDPSAR